MTANLSHQSWFVSLPLFTLGVVVLLVAVLHPLQVALQHVVLPAGTAAVVLPPQHLAYQLVLDLGQLVQDQEGVSADHEEEKEDRGGGGGGGHVSS